MTINKITLATVSATFTSAAGNYTINSIGGSDTITTGAGDSTVNVLDGNNTISMGAGNNSINAMNGNNTITTGAGASNINVLDGNNTITTGAGNSIISAGNGNNTITTGAGDSHVTALVGNNTITTGAGDSIIHTMGGDNTVTAGAGHNIITTGDGNDTITGGAGNDEINSGGGSDIVNAAAGNDTLTYNVAAHQNAPSHSTFDGGTGIDTLHLALTRAEWMSSAVQSDVAKYLTFLSANTGASGEADANPFTFSAFDLTAKGIEKLAVTVDGVAIDPVIHAPVAVNDTVSGAFLTFENGTYSYSNNNYWWNYDSSLQSGGFTFTSNTSNNYYSGNYYNYNYMGVTGYWGTDYSNALYSESYSYSYSYGQNNVGATTSIAMTQDAGAQFTLKSVNITGYDWNYWQSNATDTETITGYLHGVQVAQQVFSVSNVSNYTTSHNDILTMTDAGFNAVDKVVFSMSSDNQTNNNYYYYYNNNEIAQIIDNIEIPNNATQARDINVLANDTDVDDGAQLSVASFSAVSTHGAAITLNKDGTLHYNPLASKELQGLSQGDIVHDTFTYYAQEAHGILSNMATVSIDIVGVAHVPVPVHAYA